jgi:hypothetical protein
METKLPKLLTMEIQLYFIRDGELHALLSRHGHMSEAGATVNDPYKDHYRPTICCEVENRDFATLLDVFSREFGSGFEAISHKIISDIKTVEHPEKIRGIATIALESIEKMRLPYYSGSLLPVKRCEVADMVEVSANGMWVFNRIPVTLGNGWKQFILEGFDAFN